MTHVWIVVDAGADGWREPSPASSVAAKMAIACQDAIRQSHPGYSVGIVAADGALGAIASASTITESAITESTITEGATADTDTILCPLTFDLLAHWPAELPADLPFPQRQLFETAADVPGLRDWVQRTLGYATGSGEFWLPVVLTAKGPLYAEVIGMAKTQADSSPPPIDSVSAPCIIEEADHSASGSANHPLSDVQPLSSFQQPIHLPDRWRQPLYQLGQRLLKALSAPPSTYLIQFGVSDGEVCFDRVFPFPSAPAIASLGIQSPDLFTCHWLCLSQQPILDVAIAAPVEYQVAPF
ncbi:MAG TPA: hypothetical protein V6C88_13190 [Chroococcidiopsis sp.]